MIYALDGIEPEIDAGAWVAETAVLIGKVTAGAGANIWFGAVVMFLGGFLSLSDRRYRVGAPKRAAALQPVAAE